LKISSSSSGCESRPVKAEPSRPEASLARGREIGGAMRRYASMQAMADGFVRYSILAPRGMGFPEGSSVRDRQVGEITGAPAEWLAMACGKKTAQEPGRPYLLLAVGPTTRRGRYWFSGGCTYANHVHPAKKSVRSEVRPRRGEPEPRLMGEGSRRTAYERRRRETGWRPKPAEQRRSVSP